ncbi:MAG: T9SS type A sorting domain-containing protein [Ignavibacteria bacterium]|nr:T9SS type A sorting domain-containing protein [Ignavibacteria bacterium]
MKSRIASIALALLLNVTSVVSAQSQRDSSAAGTELNAIEKSFEHLDQFFNEKYISKGLNTKGTGYKQYLEERTFYSLNSAANFPMLEERRWEQFKQIRLANLNSENYFPASMWINLGPNSIDSFGGRMTSHAFDPEDPEIIWSGSSSGGIWRSTNGGNVWESMTDELPSMIISDIEINPADRNLMLAGTGNDRFISQTLGPGVGLLRSTDRGITWNTSNFNFNVSQNISVSKVLYKPGSRDSVFMAASNGVWVSTNSGIDWTLLINGRAVSLAIDPVSPNTLYTVLRNNGVYKSTNGGTNWFLLSGNLPQGSSVGLSTISISRSNPEILYVSFSDANSFGSLGLFKTTNAGDNWVQIANAPNVLCQPSNPTLCQGWFVNVVSIHPSDPNLVFYGGVQFWRTTNGGANWIQMDVFANSNFSFTGKTYVDQWDVGYHPQNDDVIYVFNDGGVQKSTNRGAWWNKFNTDLVTAQIYRVGSSPNDTNLIIAGFQDHGLQRLNNANGNTFWKRWSDNDGTNVIVDHANNNIFYGDFFLGVHKKSTNGGLTPQTTFNIQNGIAEQGAIIAPLIMHPENSGTLFTSSIAKIYKTTNGGLLWQPIANIPNIITLAIDKSDPNYIYGHAYDNSTWSFWKSSNGGDAWVQVTHSSIPTWRVTDLETDPSNSGTLYATRNSSQVNQDHVKRSTDFGETWSNISGDLPDIFVYAIAVSPVNREHLYIATELGVYATTNGGKNWFEFNEGLPIVRTYDIHYHPVDRTLRIATIGRGVWKAKAIDAVVSLQTTLNELPDKFTLYQNYPNPFNPSTTIRFDLAVTGMVKLVIYNSLGQKVSDLFYGDLTNGSHEIVWNATDENGNELPAGIYFLKLNSGNLSRSIKLNLIR